MNNIFLYIIYAMVSVFGLYWIKISAIGFNLNFIMGFLLYLFGFFIWLYILKSNDLSIAFPIASSALLIGTQLTGYFLLNETFSLAKILGIVFVMIGITLIY